MCKKVERIFSGLRPRQAERWEVFGTLRYAPPPQPRQKRCRINVFGAALLKPCFIITNRQATGLWLAASCFAGGWFGLKAGLPNVGAAQQQYQPA